MSLTKEQKSQVVEETTDRLKRADVVIFTNFHGLDMPGMSELRRAMHTSGVDYLVLKKRLLRIAIEQAGLTFEDELAGELGVAFGYDDPTAAARDAYTFAKAHKEEFRIIGGILDGAPATAADIAALATIPSREVLLGQLANVLQSPISGLVRTLKSLSGQQFVIVLQRISETKTA